MSQTGEKNLYAKILLKNIKKNKPVGDMARAYTGDADAVLDYGLLIAT